MENIETVIIVTIIMGFCFFFLYLLMEFWMTVDRHCHCHQIADESSYNCQNIR